MSHFRFHEPPTDIDPEEARWVAGYWAEKESEKERERREGRGNENAYDRGYQTGWEAGYEKARDEQYPGGVDGTGYNGPVDGKGTHASIRRHTGIGT